MSDTVLTVEPLGGNWVGGTMPLNFGGAVTNGKTVVPVRYPASMSKSSIYDGVVALDRTIKATTGTLLVFAHSQGAQVVSRWLRTLATDPSAPDPARVSFLLIGNPLRRYGGYGVGRPEFDGRKGLPTPNDSPYAVTDCKLQYDGWADHPTKSGIWAALNAGADRYGINGNRAIHAMGYRTANLDDPGRTTYTEGTTQYVMIPHRPLIVAPRRLIESSYNRPER